MPNEPGIFGLAAEFVSAEEILRAAQRVHDAGYRQAEAYTPFPVTGLSELLGFRRTGIPRMALAGALLGAAGAYGVCWYANVISYPWNIGNRPLNSWQAYISIVIDVMIAGAFFFAVAALFITSKAAEFNHPLFNLDAFSQATRNRYFLCIEAADERFELEQTRAFLAELGPAAIHLVPR